MTPFTTLTAIAAPLPIDNIDTDALIPKQFLTAAGLDDSWGLAAKVVKLTGRFSYSPQGLHCLPIIRRESGARLITPVAIERRHRYCRR